MTVTYVRFEPFFHWDFDESIPSADVLFFEPAPERLALTVGDRLRRIDPSFLDVDDVIIRLPVDSDLAAVRTDPILDRIAGRTRLWSLQATRHDADAPRLMPLNKGADADREPERLALDVLRDMELRAILHRNAAVFAGDETHYVLPAGEHAEKFVRLADAMRDEADVNRLVDWLVPEVAEARGILLDTGSILTVAYALTLRLREFASPPPKVVVLDEYPPDSLALLRRVVELQAQLGIDDRMVFILSANATSRLVKAFHDVAPEQKVVVIVNTGVADIENVTVLCKLPIQRYAAIDEGQCAECHKRHAIGIDRGTYERLPNLKWTAVTMDPKNADVDGAKQFWEWADSAHAVRLHTDRPYTDGTASRHHAVYLDIPGLMTTGFREVCADAFGKLEPADLVLIPEHGGTACVAGFVRERMRDVPMHHVAAGSLSDEIAEAVKRSQRVLIADDALVTGTTLVGLRRELYRVAQKVQHSPVVDGFILVSRPPSRDYLRHIERPFRDQSGIHLTHGAYVPLPLPGAVHCAWCDERDSLTLFLTQMGIASEYGRRRIESLVGERSSPLLIGTEEEQVDLVTKNSFYGELHETTAFAAVVSACLRVRELASKKRGNIDVINVAAAIDAYFDSVILGAILRTFAPRELRWPGREKDIVQAIALCDPQRLHPGTIPELLWAALRGKLPREAIDALRMKVVRPSGAIEMLNTLLGGESISR